MRARHATILTTAGILGLTACQAVPNAGMAPGTAAPPVAAAAAAAAAALGKLAGRVTDAAGAPVAGAHLLIVGHGTKTEAVSGPDGTFRVEVPLGGAYDVSAVAPDGAGRQRRAHASGPAAGGEPSVLALRLRPAGSVTGRVAFADAGAVEPAPGTAVSLAEVPGVVAEADPQGRFALVGVPDGTWTLVIRRPGFHAARVEKLVVTDGRELHLLSPLLLARDADGGQVRGTVRDGASQPVPGALVTVWPASAAAAGDRHHAHADAAGAFVVPGLAAGAYHVQVARRHLAGGARRDVTVPAAGIADAGAFVLDGAIPRGRVEGRVVDEAGAPLAGLEVRLAPGGLAATTTDGAGRFAFADVPYGDYGLAVAGTDHHPGGHDVHVGAAAVTLPTPLTVHALVPDPGAGAPLALRPPRLVLHGNVLSWAQVRPPVGVGEVVYDLEAEDAPGRFSRIATVAGNHLELPAALQGRQIRVRARAKDAAYGSGAYRIAEANMFSGWSHGAVGFAAMSAGVTAAAAAPVFTTIPHGLDAVSQLVAGGGFVYAVGPSGLQGAGPMTKGAVERADQGAGARFGRLYSHDKELNFVTAPGAGLGAEAYGSGIKFAIRSAGVPSDIVNIPGGPFGAEWGDVISGAALRFPNLEWSLFQKGSPWVVLDTAASYVANGYQVEGRDRWALTQVSGKGTTAFPMSPWFASSMAVVGAHLFVLGEDPRYPGAKLTARYNLDGTRAGEWTDPFDKSKLGANPSQLHGDPWGQRLFVLNRAMSSQDRGFVAVLDEDGNRVSTIDTPEGCLLAGMAVARNTMSQTHWVAFNASGKAYIRKYTGGALAKTVELWGVTIRYDHFRTASKRLMAATDAACWVVTDANQVLRVE